MGSKGGGFMQEEKPVASGVKISTSALGNALPVVYGRVRLAPNLIWLGQLFHEKTTDQLNPPVNEFGTRIGFGGPSIPAFDNIYYWISNVWALCEGPIEGALYLHKKEQRRLLRGLLTDNPELYPNGREPDNAWQGPVRLFYGVDDQGAWTFSDDPNADIVHKFPDPPVHYPGVATFNRRLQWLFNDAQIPNTTLEIFGLQLDPTVREVISTGVAGSGGGIRLDPSLDLSDDEVLADVPVVDVSETVGERLGDAGGTVEGEVTQIFTRPDPNGHKIGALAGNIITDMLTHELHGLDPDFWGDKIGDVALINTYSKAMGFLLGVEMSEQKETHQWIGDILKQCNCTAIQSEGQLKFISFGDGLVVGNNVAEGLGDQAIYIPDFIQSTPDGPVAVLQYEFTEDDFIVRGKKEPIRIKRPDPSEQKNTFTGEYTNRHDYYQDDTRQARNLAHIEQFGVRPAQKSNYKFLTDGDACQKRVNIESQVSTCPPNEYEFTVPAYYSDVEPGDLVGLTHGEYNLNRQPCRITDVGDDDTALRIRAVQMFIGLNTSVANKREVPFPLTDAYNEDPGDIDAPVIFEPTGDMTGGEPELWIGAHGKGDAWGGVQVFMSLDGGVDWEGIGKILPTIKIGVTQSSIAADADTFVVDFGGLGPEFELPESLSIRENHLHPIYLGGSSPGPNFVSYEVVYMSASTQLSPNVFEITIAKDLDGNRGRLGTENRFHRAGSRVMFINSNVLRVPLTREMITRPRSILFRFPSFNTFGVASQTPFDPGVMEAAHKIKATFFLAAVAPIERLVVNFSSNAAGPLFELRWARVSDARGEVEYEIRFGNEQFGRATPIGVTSDNRFTIAADGVYHVVARVSLSRFGFKGLLYRRGTPASVVVKGAEDVAANVIQDFNELPFRLHHYPSMLLAAEPHLYWRLGTERRTPAVFDEITGTQVGTAIGSPTVRLFGFVSGDDDHAYDFDGTNDAIDLGTGVSNDVNAAEFTLLWWLSSDDSSGNPMCIYSKSGGFYVGIDGSGRATFDDADVPAVSLVGTTDLRDDEKHLVALRYRRFAPLPGFEPLGVPRYKIELMVDGNVEAASPGFVLTFPVLTGQTYMAQKPDGSERFNGKISRFHKHPSWMNRFTVTTFFKAANYGAGVYDNFVNGIGADQYLKLEEREANAITDASPHDRPGRQFGNVTDGAPLQLTDSDGSKVFDGDSGTFLSSDLVLAGINERNFGYTFIFEADALQDGIVVSFYQNSSTPIGNHFRVKADGNMTVSFSGPTLGTQEFNCGTYVAGERYHVLVSWLEGIAQVLVDGTLTFAQAFGSQPLSINGKFARVGGTWPSAVSGPIDNFDGSVDELALITGTTSFEYLDRITPAPQWAASAKGGKSIDGLRINTDGTVDALPETSGVFEVPDSHIVVLPERQLASVIVGIDTVAVPTDDIRLEGAFQAIGGFKELDPNELISVLIEVGLSDTASGDDFVWQIYEPGAYLARRFKIRVTLESKTRGVIARMNQLRWTVDMPDKLQRGRVITSTTGTVQVFYPTPYVETADGTDNPSLSTHLRNITSLPVQEGDFILVTNETPAGFDIEVLNGGQRQERRVDWIANGY